ncbi:hypothetical protein [Rhodovulum sp. MB263]|uniref:hypothetical protein n=1 Tax=unclassified Rhodovulum TaxID=2631432 RepID=UPI0009B76D27|nr:hypothetical protein [Rhodovulum sp. MB263]ARC89909.1 hypothetical protein B5V46_15500 [Rhodovulum sp. MB263]
MQPVNILMTVDSITALSLGTLTGNLYLTDDAWCSQGKGTEALKTACRRGQTVNWRVLAVDVQSPAVIADIRFLDEAATLENSIGTPADTAIDPDTSRYIRPFWQTWSGIIPCNLQPGLYHYHLAFQIGAGPKSVMFTTSPALQLTA